VCAKAVASQRRVQLRTIENDKSLVTSHMPHGTDGRSTDRLMKRHYYPTLRPIRFTNFPITDWKGSQLCKQLYRCFNRSQVYLCVLVSCSQAYVVQGHSPVKLTKERYPVKSDQKQRDICNNPSSTKGCLISYLHTLHRHAPDPTVITSNSIS
jgi:hypothetical protein